MTAENQVQTSLPEVGFSRDWSWTLGAAQKSIESLAIELLILKNLPAIQVDESGFDKRASNTIYTPANHLRLRSVDFLRLRLAGVVPLQGHYNSCARQPTLLG